jgi:hypothetical protein
MKIRQPVRTMGARLAVEDNVLERESRKSLGYGQELPRPVAPIPAPQAYLLAVLAGDDAIPVVLDLVQPKRPARSPVREGGLARLDKARGATPLAGERGTHQHRWRDLCAAGGSPQGDSVPHLQRRTGNYPMLMRARCRIGLTNLYFICFDPREAKNLAPHGANRAGHFSFCQCDSHPSRAL